MMSRMYAALYPDIESTVMICVTSVTDQNIASVTLLEYGNREGVLHFPNQHRQLVVAGLVEPARVTHVQVTPRRATIRLSTDGITAEERNNCEVTYTKNLYVRSVLQHLANTRQTALVRSYTDTNWPTYDDLIDDESLYWDTLSVELRDFLRRSADSVWYSSWRITNNRILASSRLCQEGPYCLVVALIRQLECLLKQSGDLPLDESLSIQDFIDHLEDELVGETGITGMSSVQNACNTLCDIGVLSQGDGPELTWHRAEPTQRDNMMNVYAPVVADVDWFYLYDHQFWNDRISRRLHQFGPVAAAVSWFESYSEQEEPNRVLQPTPDEVAHDQANSSLGSNHVLTLVGEGMDENGIAYWEMQDSYGNVDMGDRGFLRFSKARFSESLVLMYVRMEID